MARLRHLTHVVDGVKVALVAEDEDLVREVSRQVQVCFSRRRGGGEAIGLGHGKGPASGRDAGAGVVRAEVGEGGGRPDKVPGRVGTGPAHEGAHAGLAVVAAVALAMAVIFLFFIFSLFSFFSCIFLFGYLHRDAGSNDVLAGGGKSSCWRRLLDACGPRWPHHGEAAPAAAFFSCLT